MNQERAETKPGSVSTQEPARTFGGCRKNAARHAARMGMLDVIEGHIKELELPIRNESADQLGAAAQVGSGVGEILGATIYLEIGDVERFPTRNRWPVMRSGSVGSRQRGQKLARAHLAADQPLSCAGRLWKRPMRFCATATNTPAACD